MKVAVLWNPRGGRGRASRLKPQAESTLAALAPRWIETKGGQGTTEQARVLASEGFSLIVAAGGDGTVGQVAAGLLGTSTKLAVLPFGTGNDLARCLGIGTDIAGACSVILAASTKFVDMAEWSSPGGSGIFVNVAGCGFDGEVARTINHGFRHVTGQTAYLLAILRTLRDYRPVAVRVEVDGQVDEGPAMLCAVANATSYGGGLRIAPTASLADGLLDVVRVGALGKAEFLVNFPKLLKGTHLSHPKVTHLRGRSVRLVAPESATFLTDGELVPGGDVRVKVLPGALQVVVP